MVHCHEGVITLMMLGERQAVGRLRVVAVALRSCGRHLRLSIAFILRAPKFFQRHAPNDGEVIFVSLTLSDHAIFIEHHLTADLDRKFEHSKTFGLIASGSSNAIWARDEDSLGTARRTGSGRAIVGASEEVLCWDVKKGELLGRWRDSACKAQVTVITHSKTDEDIFAVG